MRTAAATRGVMRPGRGFTLFASSRLARVARVATAGKIGVVPEQRRVAAVWDAMIDVRRRRRPAIYADAVARENLQPFRAPARGAIPASHVGIRPIAFTRPMLRAGAAPREYAAAAAVAGARSQPISREGVTHDGGGGARQRDAVLLLYVLAVLDGSWTDRRGDAAAKWLNLQQLLLEILRHRGSDDPPLRIA